MDLIDIENKIFNEKNDTVLIYNPLKSDFTRKYDGVEYSVVSKEVTKFPKIIGEHLGKHLVDAYISSQGDDYSRSKAERMVFDVE